MFSYFSQGARVYSKSEFKIIHIDDPFLKKSRCTFFSRQSSNAWGITKEQEMKLKPHLCGFITVSSLVVIESSSAPGCLLKSFQKH